MILVEAFHPKALLKLSVAAYYEYEVVKMAVDFFYPTKFLDNKDRLPLYYSLLKFNFNMPLVKASLWGDEDNVVFLVDLDVHTLGKEEFNHALEQLYFSVMFFAESMGLEDEIMAQYYENVLEALKDRMDKGESPEQLVEYLVREVGVPRRKAEEIIKEVIAAKSKEEGKESTLVM